MLHTPVHGRVLVAFVADGAGSAEHSEQAADAACVTAFSIVRDWLEAAPDSSPPDPHEVRCWVLNLRGHLLQLAAEAGHSPRDWACTLLGAVCTPQFSVYLQIGDGAIVVDEGAGARPVFWPQSGEFANQTNFLISEDALANLDIRLRAIPARCIALFTDGIQSIALDYRRRTAHEPFFGPLFAALAASGNTEAFEGQLAGFLGGEDVNRRTDDDKTLLLAVAVDVD